MTKQIICLAVVSLLVIMMERYLKPVFNWVMQVYAWLVELISPIFSHGYVGQLLKHAIPLFVSPLILTGLIAAVYWMFKRSQLAYFSEILWVIWVAIAVLLVHGL